jgi:large subunit ribosomal protein L4
MPTIDVVNGSRQVVGTLELSDEVFGDVGTSHVVWEVVRHHLAARRSGTHATKTRADVSGGGKKPWRQKGTGRARVGSSRNPLWRHGGTTHGPQPRDYDYPLPRKKKRVAARRVLASMLGNARVTVIDALQLSEPRTRAFLGAVGGLGLPPKALILVTEIDDNLRLASRNISEFKVTRPEGVNAYDLLRYRHLLATREAMDRLQEVLQP